MWTLFFNSLSVLGSFAFCLLASWQLAQPARTAAVPAEGPGKGITYIGYSPWTFTTPEGRQGLVQIFVNPDGTIESVALCYRDWSFDSWGVPHQAERA